MDAGALVGLDRQDRQVGALLRVAQQEQIPMRTSAAAVAQVWRDGARQANLARVLAGVEACPLDVGMGKQVGSLIGDSRTADVVDAHVAHLADAGDQLLTSDPDDLRTLLATREVAADVIKV